MELESPPTLEEIVKEVRISPKLLEQKCTDEHLKNISLFLGWRSVAPHLGLSEIDIKAIEAENRTEDERRLKVLQKWKKKYGYKATLKSLVMVLLATGNADDAEQVCRLLQISAATVTTPTTPGEHQQSSPLTAAETNLCSTVVESSKVSMQSLESDIDREIQELESLFFNIVSEAAEDLTAVKFSKVKLCVTQLPVSVKYQHLHFLDHNLSAIVDATSVDAIFVLLGRYWDYLNCGLLNHIVHQLGSDQTKQLMEQYMEILRLFRLKTKLGDFFGKATVNVPPHFDTFITELGKGWEDCTLEDLEQFRKKLAHSMHLKEYAMHFKSIEPGSIVVTWALPSSLPVTTDILQSAFQVLEKKCSILSVTFQGRCIPALKSQSPLLFTPPTPLPLLTPLKRSELETNNFDMITALLSAGVPHIVEQILQTLDEQSLVMSERVSSVWRGVIGRLCMWKDLIKHKIDSNPLWSGLFKRRGWYKYLDMPPAEQNSRQFYRQLYHSACRDIHSLEANWRRGHYTLTKVDTGSAVWCLQYDDSRMVTGHRDSTIKVWDRSTLDVLKVLKGHKEAVYCLQYNKEVVISGSEDLTVKVWDIQTGEVISDLLHHKGAVNSLKFTTDTLVTGSSDRTVAVWNIQSPIEITLRMALKGHNNLVLAVDFNETSIVSGSADRTIKVWRHSTGELVQTVRGHSDWVWCLQLQGSHLISGSHDETLRMWNTDSGECTQVLYERESLVICIAVDKKRILSGSYKMLNVWDLAVTQDAGSASDTRCVAALMEHTDWVRGVQCDDFYVISGSEDGTLVIHDFLDPVPPVL